jgi:hypothetical protein
LGLADRVHLAGHGLDARDRRTGDVAVTLASVVLHGATAAGLRLGEALDLDVFRATLTTRYGAVAAIRIGLLVVLLVLLAAALRQAGRGAADRAGATPLDKRDPPRRCWPDCCHHGARGNRSGRAGRPDR